MGGGRAGLCILESFLSRVCLSMPLSRPAAVLAAINHSPELREQLKQPGADLRQVAGAAGYAMDESDLDSIQMLASQISTSSVELKQFLSLLASDSAFQQELTKPDCDPVALASERGISLDPTELERLAAVMSTGGQVELSDEELEQVTGGVILEAFVAPVVVSIYAAVGLVAIGGIAAVAAVGAGVFAIYKSNK